MPYYNIRPNRDPIQKITPEQAKQFIPLSEDYTGISVNRCPYYTITPGDDGWDIVTYYTGRKHNKYAHRTSDYDSWLYVLTNPTMPGYVKIGFTGITPETRAEQLSKSTGVALPFDVAWAFHCYNAEQLEKEVHRHLDGQRIAGNREFFDISVNEAKDIINKFGQNYL
jgi:hypothetical protein